MKLPTITATERAQRPDVCEICGAICTPDRDHCHEHNYIRGWACRNCNLRMRTIDRHWRPRVWELQVVRKYLAWHNRCPDCPRLVCKDLRGRGRQGVRMW